VVCRSEHQTKCVQYVPLINAANSDNPNAEGRVYGEVNEPVLWNLVGVDLKDYVR